MIKANFNTYNTYVTDSLYQWDLNRVLNVTGLNLTVVPEVHFSNANMGKAIVRQATMTNGVVSVRIPNSLLQDPLTIRAHIGIYEGTTFKVVEKVEIPVIAKDRPSDYRIEDSDEEIYSFEALKNAVANMVTHGEANTISARIDNIIAHNNKTEGNTELVDIRVDNDGNTHESAGGAIRNQVSLLKKFNEGSVGVTFTCDSALFENGSWNHEDVKSNGEVYRVRSIGALYFPYDVLLSFADGFHVRGYWCNDSGVSVDYFNWTSSPLVIPAYQRFKIIIARITEDTTETADIAEFVKKIVLKSGLRVEIDTLKNNMDNLTAESFGLNAADFVNGWIEGWNNGVLNTTPKYRVVTPNVMYFPYDVIIHAKEGYRFALNYWKNGAFVSDELWQTEYFVPSGQRFKIMIARVTEDSTETANIAQFVEQIYVESGLKKHMTESDEKLNLLSAAVGNITPLQPINKEVYSVNHRGYNSIAPENTAPAFKLSKKKGFDFVETDVRFTSDGIPVLMHDATINRTGRNADGSEIAETINISEITYEEALTYDFGIYKSLDYAGTKIPRFEEFITICRNIGLHPYIEIEGEITAERAKTLIKIVENCGLLDNVTWISFAYESLLRIVEVYPNARVGLNCITTDGLTDNQVNYIEKLKAIGANVFIHADTNSIAVCVDDAKSHGLALELWCPNTEEEILALPTYVSGVTTDKLIAKDVLYNAFID